MTSSRLEPRTSVRDWIDARTQLAPETLRRRMLAALGVEAEAPAARTAELCLAAAARSLDLILAEERFGREHALDLLAVDALTTIAFEHACRALPGDELATLANGTASMLGQLSTHSV